MSIQKRGRPATSYEPHLKARALASCVNVVWNCGR
jgi:hypothetical protein